MSQVRHDRRPLGIASMLTITRCILAIVSMLTIVCAAPTAFAASDAGAGAIKVACVGEQTTHSDQLNRSVEYPAMLQKLLGSCYDVENFGDCCATVVQGYPTQPETHPYLDPPARYAPAFHESVTFAPDVVVIGSWGKHDTEIEGKLDGGVLDPVQWQADYEQLVTTYLNLPSRPIVYVSTPLPLPKGAATGPTTDIILPAIQNVAAKYHLTIVPLYPAFLNQPQLYKDDTHPTDTTGLTTIANTVYATMVATMGSCGDGGLVSPPTGGGAGADAGASDDGDAGVGPGGSGAASGSATGSGSSAGSGESGLADGAAAGSGSNGDTGASSSSGCACGVAGESNGSRAMGLLGAGLIASMLTIRRRRPVAPARRR
jgi:MYXO-CTERM domain-containing protein